ncbi:ABC transporter permease [Thermanaerosceptrum fracticalcis]|uniref:Transport permease protein n=1 Tax=Thermanaerosceptrum fracticalcis TaxID=1712410 RepID=A0A7G6E4K2_THEFR|nr:ABC transporter permease [Thermanaerosceptrum fracticalcis]QNB47006.1 ABC transporter permease [Thermanaerosceptrum fracticalcis]
MGEKKSQNHENWTNIIQPRKGWFDINLKEIWQYRDLIMLFVRRDFVSIYKQTILGPIWFILQPLFTTITFTIVFGKIAQIPTEGIPEVLFYMSGIVCWNYFASCLNKTSDTFFANAGIFGKVYFPRLVVPISTVITNMFTFTIQFVLFLLFLLYFKISGSSVNLTGWVFFTPLLLLYMATLGLGVGIFISSLTTKYRDLTFLVGFGVQLWMYATPIVYPLSQVPERWRWLYSFNPMTVVIETFRYAFLGMGTIQLWQIGFSVMITTFIFLAGLVLFGRVEKTFMDTI